MFLKNLFSSDSPDLEFVDFTRTVYPHYPIQLAKDVKPFMKEHQEKIHDNYKFPGCPGMHDYSRLGYIMPAWTDIHIKANKAGAVIRIGSSGDAKKQKQTPYGEAVEVTGQFQQAFPMATDVTEGLFEFSSDVKPTAWNVPGAWKIYGKKNISALLLPAVYHSPFLNDIFVYPGVVDYREFAVANFIMSPKRKCELTIKAGTPLMHIIPMITVKDIEATYGPGTTEQLDKHKVPKHFFADNWYRKFYMIKKKFKLSKQVD